MFGSYVLDFALGMIFVYLLLSLICSALNEFIEAQLKNRAVDLERGLRELLNDPNGTGLVKQLYEHPLVYGLFKGAYDPKKRRNLPSYIPARNFAAALLDIARQGPPAALAAGGAGGGPGAPAGGAAAAGAAAGPGGAPANPMDAIRVAVANIQNPFVQRALTTLVDTSGSNVNKFLEATEAWYNSGMERVSGWYKRRVQWIIIGLALALAVALNADTLVIADHLSQDPSLRSAVVSAAANYVNTQPQDGTPADRLKQNMDTLGALALPIGWASPDCQKTMDPRQPPCTFGGWLLKILGWLMTVFAISLGAPFWFDLLNKVVGLRSTLKPEPKAAAKS